MLGLMRLFTKYPAVAGVFGLVIAAMFGVLGVGSWLQLQKLPAQPRELSITEVDQIAFQPNEQVWVLLTDSRWDCRSIRYIPVDRDERTEVIATDANETIIVLAQFSRQFTCDQLQSEPLTGFLSPMDQSRYARFVELNHFDPAQYRNPTQFFDLCGFCDRGNSTLGVWAGAIMVALGLSFYPLFKWGNRKSYSRSQTLKDRITLER